MMLRNGLALFVSTSFGLAFAQSDLQEPKHLPSLRLIQISPTQAKWMNDEEVLSLQEKSHQSGHCGGFMDITDHQDLEWYPIQKFSLTNKKLVPKNQSLVEPLLNQVSVTRLHQVVLHLSTQYQNRYYKGSTGIQAATWIRDQFQQIAQSRSDVSVRTISHSFDQPSVLARIEGKGPLRDEIVILGGHLDSIKQWSLFKKTAHAPGADDNASGIATLLEVFQILVESGYQPDRSIEFIGYAGEEKGLLGSQAIARSYQQRGEAVVGVIQFDMTMHPHPNEPMVIIRDNTDPELSQFVAALLDEYVQIPWQDGKCGYACSDHASWNKSGFPAAFATEAPTKKINPRIHTSNDTLEHLDISFGRHFAHLGLAFAIELGTHP